MKEVKTIAIVGGGELGQEIYNIAKDKYQIDIINHDNLNVASQHECDKIVPRLSTYDAVIITVGLYSEDIWNMWLVNTVGPCHIISKLNEVSTEQRIVAVSSHGSSWTSWPNAPTFRLSYNVNKLALNEFCTGLVQQGNSSNKISIFEPSRFKSKNSNYLGADISDMAHELLGIISSPTHIVHKIVKEL